MPTIRLPFLGDQENRFVTASKDQHFFNCFVEGSAEEQYLVKRTGSAQHITPPGAAATCRMLYAWNNALYSVFGNTLYKDTTVLSTGITAGSGAVGCTEIYDTAEKLFIADGTKGFLVTTSGTVTEISNQQVGAVTVTSGGDSYYTAPSVTFSSGSATATAVVENGAVTSIVVTDPGSGYASAPTVTLGAPSVSFNPTVAVPSPPSTYLYVPNAWKTTERTQVTYSNGGGTTMGGLVNGATYYIIPNSPTAFQVSGTLGGTAISITSAVAGTHSFTATSSANATATATVTLNSFPTPHIPTPVSMDGYVALQKTSGEIFNSGLNTPKVWAATDFLLPQAYQDTKVGLARQNNLIVAFGSESVEFLYDAGTSGGSPFAPNTQAVIQYGCASINSVAQEEGMVVFVAKSKAGEPFVVALSGTQDQIISTDPIVRVLVGERSTISSCTGMLLRMRGHLFYVLKLPTSARTLVFDFVTKVWGEWTYQGSSYPFVEAVYLGNTIYLAHPTDGYIHKVYGYGDHNTAMAMSYQSANFDGGTKKAKFLSRLSIVGDTYATANPVGVSWSDDDYQTFSTERTVDLNSPFAWLDRCGSFIRRAFKVTNTSTAFVRMRAFELEIDQGPY